MSAIETMPEVVIAHEGNRKTNDGMRVTTHPIAIRGDRIGSLNYYPDSMRIDTQWQVTLFGSKLCGYGATPADAIRDVFGDSVSEMQSAIDRAKAIAVVHGDALVAAAEGLE